MMSIIGEKVEKTSIKLLNIARGNLHQPLVMKILRLFSRRNDLRTDAV